MNEKRNSDELSVSRTIVTSVPLPAPAPRLNDSSIDIPQVFVLNPPLQALAGHCLALRFDLPLPRNFIQAGACTPDFPWIRWCYFAQDISINHRLTMQMVLLDEVDASMRFATSTMIGISFECEPIFTRTADE